MKVLVVACALLFCASAFATTQIQKAVGVKSCSVCHEGAPKNKRIKESIKNKDKHVEKKVVFEGAKVETCKACHPLK